ncbi:MAG: ComEC/Rec2 family competence protein [Clostridia bacterium]|nr:ComEC/Rec2 family competence protein [Clostridia bacterium]
MSILNRKLALIFTGFTAGVFLYQYSPFLTLILLPLALISLKITGKRGIVLILTVSMFFLGGTYTLLTEKIGYRKADKIAGIETEITGTVISIPEVESYGQSAVCRTKYGKIRLMTSEPILRYKDNVTFTSKSYYPEEKSRPFAFDYPLYLKSEGIYLQAFASELRVNSNKASYLNPIDVITILRSSLIKKADMLWSGEALMFSRAILLGDTSYSSDEFRDKLSEGSISHIIAVSGTHVSFVCAMFLLITSTFAKRKRYLNLLSIPLIIAFVILTGASPSSVRAALMMLFYLIAKSTLSHYDGFTILSTASFLILITNPFTAFSLSFILSFSAVLGILLFAKPLSDIFVRLHLGFIAKALAVTLSAQVFTIISLCFSFGRFPFTALIANLAAVPLVPFIMTAGYISLIIAFIFPAFNITALLTEVLMGLCIAIADFSRKLPLANIYPVFCNVYVFASIFIFFTAALTAILIYKAKKTAAVFLLLFLLSVGLNLYLPGISGDKAFYFADAGHGDSTFIFNKTTSVMAECLSPEDKFVENTVIPILRQHGHSELDALILSEYDPYNEDVTELTKNFHVKAIYIPSGAECENLSETLKQTDTEIIFVSMGDSFLVDEISITVPYSEEGFCSYIIDNSGKTLLLPGNMEEKTEKLLAEKASDVDILKAPRHGNKGSCTEELLNATRPNAVIVSTGRKLSDNFKSRLSSYDVYSTKTRGDISIATKNKIKISPYKKVTK